MAGPAFKLEVGQVIEERYLLERVVGQGGMGIVYAARHLELRETVAIKMLQSTSVQDPNHIDRFLREARLASRIKSEHVVRVLDVARGRGEVPPYIVMEYLEGSDLADVVARGGPLPTIQAVDYLLQACEAVAEAHRMGIVHRDLKPSNLIVTQRADGTPLLKVLDFGISKTDEREESSSITTTSAVFGSPAYMSPEQIRSAKNVDARSDVWALAIVLFELLTGRLPFDGENAAAILAAVSADAPLPLTRFAPAAPLALQKVVEACLVKDRTQRISSVVQMAELLSPFASATGRSSVASVRAIGSMPATRLSAPPSGAQLTGQGMATTVAVDPKFHTDQALVVNSQTRRGLRAPAVAALVGTAGGVLVLAATWTTMNFRHRAGPGITSASTAPSALASPAPDPDPPTPPATLTSTPQLDPPDPPPPRSRPAPASDDRSRPPPRVVRPKPPAPPASVRPHSSSSDDRSRPPPPSGTSHVPDTDSRQ